MVGYIVLYIAVSVVIGLLGNNRKLGFWGYLFASILLTPILGFLLLIVSAKK